MGIERTHLAGTMIAYIVVELGQCAGYVIFAAPVNDIRQLIGIGVIKAKTVFERRGGGGL
jgi:hypothetical protein